MRDLAAAIDTYLEAYSEADPERRRQLIAHAWSTDGRLIDPPMDASGRDAIHEMAGAVQGQFPDTTFRRTTGIDSHHRYARYGWELVGHDGSAVLDGTDIVHVGEDGKLTTVLGFFGDIPTE